MKFTFPAIYAVDYKDKRRNIIKQLLSPPRPNVDIEYKEYSKKGIRGYILREKNQKEKILLVTNTDKSQERFNKIIRLRGFKKNVKIDKFAADIDFTNKYWLYHPDLKKSPKKAKKINLTSKTNKVIKSWESQFSFIEEIKNDKGEIIKPGLRTPQLGAIYAVLSNWTLTDNVATVVMPTGTGKTEVMLSLLIRGLCEKLLVVVPTDALRNQISKKFINLGVLKDFGIISDKAIYPIVGIIKHKFKSPDEANHFFKNCNVAVTTMNIAGQMDSIIQKSIVEQISHLFIDEAHHTEAPTWREFKDLFHENPKKRIIQFTATPFRNDGKRLDGEIIFRYPIRLAQKEKYFAKINFDPINEYDTKKHDKEIAKKAIKQLQNDLDKGYNHVLMARVKSIERAQEVFKFYKPYTKLKPVQIHTGIKSVRDRKSIREKIINKEARIVICVDMLGEGFDLPELKIAAFHDIRKSLPITLQLVGRFARPKEGRIGEATVIANMANQDTEDELSELYAQDADWNQLISDMSGAVNERIKKLIDFLSGFKNFPKDLPLQNIKPALSTVIYKTNIFSWKPENFREGFNKENSSFKIYHDINKEKNILVIVTVSKIPLIWGKFKEEDFFDVSLDLHILYWSKQKNLLFINTSNTSSYYRTLAEAVAGKVSLINGPNIFRCLYNIHLFKYNNMGARNIIGRLISFIMRMGSDVGRGLSKAMLANTSWAVLFGHGFEEGKKTSMGCSIKGRIWSHKRGNIDDLVNWCDCVGDKVLNKNIYVPNVLKGTIIPIPIFKRPKLMPIAVDWPNKFYRQLENKVSFHIGNIKNKEEMEVSFLYESSIDLANPSKTGPLTFSVSSDKFSAEYQLILFATIDKDGNKIANHKFVQVSGDKIYFFLANKFVDLKDIFNIYSPSIKFSNGSQVEGNLIYKLRRKRYPFSLKKIIPWDWMGVDIQKESQGVNKNPNTIQYRVIQKLKLKNYDVIFDDDDTGEAADVVTIKKEKKEINVEFYHCKFSNRKNPGCRLEDLYEVCGQAQKSIRWMESPTELFNHLFRREPKTKKRKQASRFEKGTPEKLEIIKRMSRSDLEVNLSIFIVQPGLSKDEVRHDGREHLELLGVTENYLMETYMLPLKVITSE